MSKEAMKLALEAMMQVSPSHHSMPNRVGPKEAFDQLMAAITSIRQAIAEAEKQEPVFWYRPVGEDGLYEGPIHNASIERVRKECGAWQPLYTTPQQRPTSLTDALLHLFQEWKEDHLSQSNYIDAIEQIKAAHGIKE